MRDILLYELLVRQWSDTCGHNQQSLATWSPPRSTLFRERGAEHHRCKDSGAGLQVLVVLVLGGVGVNEAGTGDKCVSGTGLGLASVVDSGVGVGDSGIVAEDIGGAGGGLPKCFLLVLCWRCRWCW